jgi:hypothetical protein
MTMLTTPGLEQGLDKKMMVAAPSVHDFDM